MVVAQVNKQIYTFCSLVLCCTYRAPVKSIPITVNGATSLVRTIGSGAGSGAGYGLPICLLQMVQHHSSVLMYYLAVSIQNCCLVAVNVLLRYRFNATSHLRVLHTQIHNPLLARESTRTSRLGNRVEETR